MQSTSIDAIAVITLISDSGIYSVGRIDTPRTWTRSKSDNTGISSLTSVLILSELGTLYRILSDPSR